MQNVLYTEQQLNYDEIVTLTLKHLGSLISNFEHLKRGSIKGELVDLQDLIYRYPLNAENPS